MCRKKPWIIMSMVMLIGSCLFSSCSRVNGIEETSPMQKITWKMNDILSYSLKGDYSGLIYVDSAIDIQNSWNKNEDLQVVSLKKITPYIQGSWDKESDLCNGEIITWKWQIDYESIKDLYAEEGVNIKIDYEDIVVEINDFPERETFNVFDNLTYELSGISPFITIEYSLSSYDFLNGVFDDAFSCSKTEYITEPIF